MTKTFLTLFASMMTLSAAAEAAPAWTSENQNGYRCEYAVHRREGSYFGSCEHTTLKKARALMFRRAKSLGGTPGACVPTNYVVPGCD